MPERTLVLRLSVDAGQSVNTLSQYQKAMTDAERATKELGGTTTQTGGLLSNLDSAVKTVAGAFVAWNIGDKILELRELGEKANIAETIFTQLAGGTTEAAETMGDLREATLGVVDDMTLWQGTSRLLAMGLAQTNDMAEELIGGAVRLGAAFGKEAGPAIEDFSLMLANQSYLRLDTFGLSSARVRERVEELKDQFPELDKSVRFSMAVAEEMDRALGRLGDAANATGTSVRRLETEWRNAMTDMGQEIAKVIEGLSRPLDQGLQITAAFEQRAHELSPLVEDMSEQFRQLFGEDLSDEQFARAVAQIQMLQTTLGRLPTLEEARAPIAGGLVANVFDRYGLFSGGQAQQLYATVVGQLDDVNRLEEQRLSNLEQTNYELSRMQQAQANMGTANRQSVLAANEQDLTDFENATMSFQAAGFGEFITPERNDQIQSQFAALTSELEHIKDLGDQGLLSEDDVDVAQRLYDKAQGFADEAERASAAYAHMADSIASLTGQGGGGAYGEISDLVQQNLEGRGLDTTKFEESAALFSGRETAISQALEDEGTDVLADIYQQYGADAYDTAMDNMILGIEEARATGMSDDEIAAMLPSLTGFFSSSMTPGMAGGMLGGSALGTGREAPLLNPEAAAAFDPTEFISSLTEAEAPISGIAADMTTSAEQSGMFETHMGLATGHVTKVRTEAETIANILGDLGKKQNDIPVRLMLDRQHFHMQLASELSWFEIHGR